MTTASGSPGADDLAAIQKALDKVSRGDIVVADVEDALDRLAARFQDAEAREKTLRDEFTRQEAALREALGLADGCLIHKRPAEAQKVIRAALAEASKKGGET